MPELTPTEISKQWRVSKTTVYKHLNKGRMSYRTDEDGHKLVDVSEVVRVFGEPVLSSKPSATNDLNRELVNELKNRINSLEEKLSKRDEQLDKLLESLNNVTMRLEQHPTPTEAPPTEPEPEPEQPKPEPKKKRSLFTRILTAAIEA